jgi:hypothetical protein
VVNGGDEPMCIAETRSAWWQQEHGRPCPRIELDSRNIEAYALMNWLVTEELRPLTPLYADALLDGREPDERQCVLARIGLALRSRDVVSRLRPEMTQEKG